MYLSIIMLSTYDFLRSWTTVKRPRSEKLSLINHKPSHDVLQIRRQNFCRLQHAKTSALHNLSLNQQFIFQCLRLYNLNGPATILT